MKMKTSVHWCPTYLEQTQSLGLAKDIKLINAAGQAKEAVSTPTQLNTAA